MPWVTINGSHVLIGEGGGDTGGGHTGTHNPAIETGNSHVDKILPKAKGMTVEEYMKGHKSGSKIAQKFIVKTQVHPQLGGLGWVTSGEYSSRADANAHLKRLISEGTMPARVKISK